MNEKKKQQGRGFILGIGNCYGIFPASPVDGNKRSRHFSSLPGSCKKKNYDTIFQIIMILCCC
jgi:hypothetical protein